MAVVTVSNITLSGEQTIDGFTTSGSLVLATAQTTASQNGPWVSGTGAWTRPAWYSSGSTTQAPQYATTFVRLGTIYHGTTWRLITAGVTIDTTATNWVGSPVPYVATVAALRALSAPTATEASHLSLGGYYAPGDGGGGDFYWDPAYIFLQPTTATTTMTAAGGGYHVNDVLEVCGGTAVNPAYVHVTAVDGTGAITGYELLLGSNYSSLPPASASTTLYVAAGDPPSPAPHHVPTSVATFTLTTANLDDCGMCVNPNGNTGPGRWRRIVPDPLTLNVLWFGAKWQSVFHTGSAFDSLPAINKAIAALPSQAYSTVPSPGAGNTGVMRGGTIYLPEAPINFGFVCGGTIYLSAGVSLIGGASSGGTMLTMMAGTAPDAAQEQFLIQYLPSGSTDVGLYGSVSDSYYTRLENLNLMTDDVLSTTGLVNPGGSCAYVAAANNAFVRNINIGETALRGVVVNRTGCVIDGYFSTGYVHRGPSLELMGAHIVATHISPTHTNSGPFPYYGTSTAPYNTDTTDPITNPDGSYDDYPALLIESNNTVIGDVDCEGSRIGVKVRNALEVHIGPVYCNDGEVGVKIVGQSANVDVKEAEVAYAPNARSFANNLVDLSAADGYYFQVNGIAGRQPYSQFENAQNLAANVATVTTSLSSPKITSSVVPVYTPDILATGQQPVLPEALAFDNHWDTFRYRARLTMAMNGTDTFAGTSYLVKIANSAPIGTSTPVPQEALVLVTVAKSYGENAVVQVNELEGTRGYAVITPTSASELDPVTLGVDIALIEEPGEYGGSCTVTVSQVGEPASNGVATWTAVSEGTADAPTDPGVFNGTATPNIPTMLAGNTFMGAGTLSLGTGKTFAVSNSITLAGTDNSTLNVGSGGTLQGFAFRTLVETDVTGLTTDLAAKAALTDARFPTVTQGTSPASTGSGTSGAAGTVTQTAIYQGGNGGSASSTGNGGAGGSITYSPMTVIAGQGGASTGAGTGGMGTNVGTFMFRVVGGAGGMAGAGNGGPGGTILDNVVYARSGSGGTGGTVSGANGGSGGTLPTTLLAIAGNGGTGGSASGANGGSGGSAGSITLNGGSASASVSGPNGGSSGSIVLSGGTASNYAAGSGGSLNATGSSATGSGPGFSAGSLNLSGGATAAGGSIDTSNGGGSILTHAVVFASAIASPVEGTMQAFTNSTTNTWGATIAGGGTYHVLGYFDGTNWTVMAK